jgi:hypothetical protein
VIAALDARMGEAYLAAYARSGDDWDEVIAPRLAEPRRCRRFPGAAGPPPAAASTATRGCAMPIASRSRCASRATCRAPGRRAHRARGASRAAPACPRAGGPLYLRDKVGPHERGKAQVLSAGPDSQLHYRRMRAGDLAVVAGLEKVAVRVPVEPRQLPRPR